MVRTRIAPSPTGNLHMGTARVALFNFLFARHERGTFIVRIEDTDKERSRSEFEKDITEGLTWLGLKWDEFYRQSERLEHHQKYLELLLEKGSAFWCTHPQEETKGSVHFCPDPQPRLSGAEAKQAVIRFKTPRGREVRFDDKIRGNLSFHTDEVGDFSLAKNEETPLYNLAVVIDDYEMEISHVIRGEDHISNTPKQILLQEALGFFSPAYAHLPLVLGPDRSKLSKRHGATAIRDYKEKGYLPQAMVNAMAFLGWNPGGEREFFTLEELVKEFSLERIKKGGSIFDIKRLNFINEHYIKELSPDAYAEAVCEIGKERYPAIDREPIKKIAILSRGTASTMLESLEKFDPILAYPPKHLDYPAELLVWKKADREKTLDALKKMETVIKTLPEEASLEAIKEAILNAFAGEGDKGLYLWPLRVALYGQEFSPGPFEGVAVSMAAEGKEDTLKRIQIALEKLNTEY